MTRYLVVLMLILLSAAAFAGEDVAAEYINSFFARDFQKMFELQDEQMRSAMSARTLSELYTNIIRQFGELKELLGSDSTAVDEYTSHTFAISLKSGIYDFVVTVDKQSKVAGFFVRPSTYGMQEPGYADKERFVEQQITVGEQPYLLNGYLTVPVDRESFPLVILVQGSGSHDADVTMGPNKVFRDIAWGLASRGIGVLRYEKRTFRYGEEIIEAGAVATAEMEYIEDLLVIVEQARSIPGVDQIIIAGHSLGGSVAPWVAEETGADKIVLLAASPKRLAEISMQQNIDLAPEYGIPQEQLDQVIALFEMILNHALPEGTPIDPQAGITVDYYYSFDRYLSMPILRETDLPVLIVSAEFDFQIPLRDFREFEEELGDRENVELVLLSGLNHIFMPVDSLIKTVEQYYVPGVVDESLIVTLSDWISATY